MVTLSSGVPPHILIVDDEDSLRRTLSDFLQRKGYRTAEAASGEEALEYLAQETFDVVLLDLKMPGMDGTEVLKSARPLAPETVFIILTAYGTLDSAIIAIRCGAFDYLLKPSPPEEIIRAVEAGLMKRRKQVEESPIALLERALATLKSPSQKVTSPPPSERFLQTADLTVDVQRRLVVADGKPVELTPTEFDILVYLMRHPDRVVSAQELALHLRGCALEKDEAYTLLRSHVHRLRSKLERNPAHPRWIHTVRGVGYMFSGK